MNKDIIDKFLRSNASEEEIREIKQWIAESDENRKYLAEQKALWVLSTMPDTKANSAMAPKFVKKKNFSISRIAFYTVAATLVLLLTINIVLLNLVKKDDRVAISNLKSEELSTIYTEKGTKAVVSLPDGSKVWLNSDTKISYPTGFPGSTREVFISGEAYFEVQTDSLKPMMVTTQKGYIIKVLGTKFYVKSYLDDQISKATLISGNIKLIYPAKTGYKNGMEINVHPSETIIMGSKSVPKLVKQTPRVNANAMAWKEGELVFDGTSLYEAIKMIERWHGAKFDIKDNSVLHKKISARFKSESLV